MRFFLDNDVPVSVRTMLVREGHEAWSAGEAGLAVADDDDLTVYAVRHTAVLISLDEQFMRRRRAKPGTTARRMRLALADVHHGEQVKQLTGQQGPRTEQARKDQIHDLCQLPGRLPSVAGLGTGS